MSLDRTHWTKRGFRRPVVAVLAGLMVFASILASNVQADPADDALAKLNELSRQAEQTTESMHSAQLDLNNKLAVQQAADVKHAADLAAVESAKSQLAKFQASVDKLASAQYMGGRTDGLDAILTATSPQGLIDQLAVQRVMAAEMSAQMKSYRDIGRLAAVAEQASAQSAADAKTAAEQAAAVRAELQSKQSKLQLQIAVVKSQYVAPRRRRWRPCHRTLRLRSRRRPRCHPWAIPRFWPPRRVPFRRATSHLRPVGTPRPSFRPR